MLTHLLRAAFLTLALIACIFLPFLPGPYDPTAVVLSSIAQTIAFGGIMLIPIGVIWGFFGRGHRTIRIISAAVASMVVTLAAALGATVNNSISLAIGLLVLGTYLSFCFVRRVSQCEGNPFPLYFIVVPLLVLTARVVFIQNAVEFSRNLAIENSRPLIHEIETYRARNGHYPVSLHSQLEDYDPSVIGIGRYYYEPNGSAYNLFFEQFSNEIGVREFVMYNTLGEHKFSAHNSDILEFSEADRIRQQGWHVVVALTQEHWKYFHFD